MLYLHFCTSTSGKEPLNSVSQEFLWLPHDLLPSKDTKDLSVIFLLSLFSPSLILLFDGIIGICP